MCDTGNDAEVTPVEALPASVEWKGDVLPLEPVDELSVLTVCDNAMDMLLPDEGPAKRLPLAGMARLAPLLEAPTILGGKAADVPLAEHGFSALVEIRKGGRVRRLLFDTGLTPAGCAGNLRRLGKDPADIEVIVCSHGHFDHTTGLSGLIGRLGRGTCRCSSTRSSGRGGAWPFPVSRSSCPPPAAAGWKRPALTSSSSGSRRSCLTGRC